MTTSLWEVAVNAPLNTTFTYECPPELQDQAQRGTSVIVPLGKRKETGVLIQPTTPQEEYKIKCVESIIEDRQPLPESFLKWAEWLHQYYIYPLGLVLESAFPPLSEKTKKRKTSNPPVVPSMDFISPPNLTEEQAQCLKDISIEKKFQTHLIFGVTGSGKTEIYLQLLQSVIEQGNSGLVLVPEISLTPQLIRRFSERFGPKVALIHSQLTEREKTDQWYSILKGETQILVGARSALFCPIPRLSMIVVDEEHEPSFKQEEKLKYHARDAAIMRAKFEDCPILLGSATPSIESWHNAQVGKYQLHTLKHRVEDRQMPLIEVIDLRKSAQNFNEAPILTQDPQLPSWLHPHLFKKLKHSLENGHQAALFLNRRGLAHSVICPDCGAIHKCPNCSVSLTLHAKSHLVCHYCNYQENFREKCFECKTGELRPLGLGTELIEKDLQQLFPGARIARADRDEIQNRKELEELISQIEKQNVNILVGTQMIAKGLDFKNLNLVGHVLADVGFNIPDFRASERSFQLLTQMSGRAGRHRNLNETPGEVFIQTYNPHHVSIEYAKNHDYVGFAEQELKFRQELMYPPFGRLISLRIQGLDQNKIHKTLSLLEHRIHALKNKFTPYHEIEILGPTEAPLKKLKGLYRYYVLLKAPKNVVLNSFCQKLIGNSSWIHSGTRIIIDVDPMNLL